MREDRHHEKQKAQSAANKQKEEKRASVASRQHWKQTHKGVAQHVRKMQAGEVEMLRQFRADQTASGRAGTKERQETQKIERERERERARVKSRGGTATSRPYSQSGTHTHTQHEYEYGTATIPELQAHIHDKTQTQPPTGPDLMAGLEQFFRKSARREEQVEQQYRHGWAHAEEDDRKATMALYRTARGESPYTSPSPPRSRSPSHSHSPQRKERTELSPEHLKLILSEIGIADISDSDKDKDKDKPLIKLSSMGIGMGMRGSGSPPTAGVPIKAFVTVPITVPFPKLGLDNGHNYYNNDKNRQQGQGQGHEQPGYLRQTDNARTEKKIAPPAVPKQIKPNTNKQISQISQITRTGYYDPSGSGKGKGGRTRTRTGTGTGTGTGKNTGIYEDYIHRDDPAELGTPVLMLGDSTGAGAGTVRFKNSAPPSQLGSVTGAVGVGVESFNSSSVDTEGIPIQGECESSYESRSRSRSKSGSESKTQSKTKIGWHLVSCGVLH